MDNVSSLPNQFAAENQMLSEIQDLVESYNGRLSNVAMLGILQASSNLVFLSIAQGGTEDE